MLSDKKMERHNLIVAGLLLGVPFMLIACNGNPLNGEKLSLFGANEPKASPAVAPQGQKQSPHPVATPAPAPAPACTINIKGTLESNDLDLVAFNKDVMEIEGTLPPPSKLRELIRDSVEVGKLSLTHPELKNIATNIMARAEPTPAPSKSDVTAPIGSPGAVTTDSTEAAAIPYYLHPSIVGFVAFKRAVAFALDRDGLSLTASEAKKFIGKTLTHEQVDRAILAYIKAFRLALNPKGLSYTSSNAQKMVDRIFDYGVGIDTQVALAWVNTYNNDQTYFHFDNEEALKDANAGLCYATGSDPLAGFTGTLPQQIPKATNH